MNSYCDFAQFYDRLTLNVGYKERAEYIERLLAHFGHESGVTLDLACGTGSLTLELFKRGFDIFGADASSEMLSVAQQKAYENDAQILYICQKMQSLNLYSSINTCLCTLDSINHLTKPENVKKTFAGVAKYLEKDGLFVFDVNTIYKHQEVLAENCFVYDTDDVFCSWQNRQLENNTVEITLDFFIPEENGSYIRSTECFAERAYSDEDLTMWLEQVGLKVKAIYGDMTFDEPKSDCQRKIFVAGHC